MFKKEESNVIDLDEILKKRRRKERFKNSVESIANWTKGNMDLVMFFGPAILGGVVWAAKATHKHIKLNKEKNLKEMYCYGRSLGHYWKLKRELTNSEWVSIDKRKMNGERLADILSELKVLK